MMMFKEPYRNNIANSLFTGLNILVTKSETTDDLIYNECVEYLNANLTSIQIKDLTHKEDENDRPQLYSSTQAKALSIFTNFKPNTETSYFHVHPFDTLSDKLLNHPNISKHINRTSIISVRYHTEYELERQGKLRIFSPQNAIALVIVDNDVTEPKARFYEVKDRLSSKYGIFIQFMLVKFNGELEIVSPSDISEDCETEANAIHTANDSAYLDFNKNSVFLINSAITKYLRTVVYHILRYLVHSILDFLDSPEYEHEFLTKCYDISTPSNIYKGRLYKIVGDMYMLLDNVDLAISSYISSEQQCKAVSDNMFLGKSSLCLALALSIKHSLSMVLRGDNYELGAGKPLCFSFFTDWLLHTCIPTHATRYRMSVKNINTDRDYPANIDDTLDDIIEISDDAINAEETVDDHAENDNARDKKASSDPREAISSAFERAFNAFIELKNNSTLEFELLFIIFSNWLSSIKYNIQLHSVISKFIKYSQLNKNIQEQCRILKYIIDISNVGKYKRKLNFYLYLHEVAINSLKDPVYETCLGDLKLAKPEHKYIEANDCNVECLINSMIHYIESNVLNGFNAVHNNHELRSKMQLSGYGHWYHICRAWINVIIKRYAQDRLYDELYHLIFIKFWMTINYVLEYRPREESSVGIIDEAVMELKEQFLSTPSNNKLLCITHLICNASENKNLRQRRKYTNPRDILDSNIRHLFDSYRHKNSILFFGYFGQIKLSKAPLVLSMSCDVGITKTIDTDTGFTHDLMTKSENNRGRSKSDQKIQYFIKIKKRHLYRTCCKCSFKGIFQNYGKTSSPVESLSSSTDNLKTSFKGTEPHSRILNNKIYDNNKCVIVRYGSKHGDECIESCETKPKALGVRETCVLATSGMATDQVYEIELELYNPLPIPFTMGNLMFITIGSKIDVLCDNIRIPAFSNSYKVKLPIMMKQAGTIYILGLSFTAFNVFRFNQMVLQGTADLMKEFSLNFGKATEIKDEVLDNFRKGASIVFNVSHKRDNARVNCYITNFNSTSKVVHHESFDYICKYTKNTFETYSSVIGPNDKRKYEFWSGIKIPLFDDGCISRLTAQCTERYCIWRRIFELHGKESILEDRSVFDRVIQGERRLVYITLVNESKAFKFSNVQLAIIPKFYEEEQSSKFDVKTWEDINLERMKENLTFRENQCIVSKCLYIANNECVVVSKDLFTQLGEKNPLPVEICSYRKDVENRAVSLNYGDMLCVPVIYKADYLLCNFHVIFDYELEFISGGLSRRGSAYMELNFDVDYGIKIDDVNLESCVEFDYKRLLRNISIFSNCYMDSTLFVMSNSVHIFDHRCVKAYLNVLNDTDVQFKCTTHLNELISVPGSNIRWCIKIKRLNYLKAKYIKPWEFVKILDSKLGLKWNIDSKRTGDMQIHDTALYREPVKCTRSKLPRDYYRNELLSIYQKPFIWKMVGINNSSNLVIYPLKIPSLIDKNLHNLVMSKVSLELSVSIPSGERSYSSGDQVQIPVGLPFNFHVCAKNTGDKIIDDYCVLVFPYVHESYAEPSGLSWIGSLERVGHCAILPESKRRQDMLKSESKLVIRDIELNSSSSVQRSDQSYTSCAHVTFIAHGSCVYGINAAIIIKSENNVYWHHAPIIITTT